MGLLEHLFGGLTKTAVTAPDGSVVHYNAPLDAVKAQAIQNEGSVNPISATLNSTINPTTADAPTTELAQPATTYTQPTGPRDATVSQPDFVHANSGMTSPDLTTKGKVLSGLLSGVIGGFEGAGKRTVGEGFQQALTLPIDIQQRQARAQQTAAQAALTQEQVASLPQTNKAKIAQQTADMNLKNAEAQFYASGKNVGTPEARTDFANAHPEFFNTPEEKANYALFGSKQPNLAQLHANAVNAAVQRGVDPSTDPTVQHLADAITGIQKPTAAKDPNKDDKYIALEAKVASGQQLSPEEQAFKSGYEHYVKVNKVDPGVARTSVLLQMPTAVADPNNPGGVVYATRKGAIGQGAPGGIDTKVPLAVAQDFAHGADAKTLTNINTAESHINQLRDIGTALHNGNLQLANQLGNTFATATGSAAPLDFQLLKTALAAEIGKTTTGGVATMEETKELTKALNSANSPAQLIGVTNEASKLMASKRDRLHEQYTQGMQGKPNFNPASSQQQQSPTPNTHVFSLGAWQKVNPSGDPNAAKAAAQQQGFQVVQ